MCNKTKILLNKPALLGNEAAVLLADLTHNDLSPGELLQVGANSGLRVFIETNGIGFDGFAKTEVGTGQEVTPTGLHEVVRGLTRHVNVGEGGGGNPALEIGDSGYVFKGEDDKGQTVEWEVSGKPDPKVLSSARIKVFLFKPADIQALADKLNDTASTAAQDNEAVGNWPLIAAAFAEQALADGKTNLTSLIECIASKKIAGLGKSTLWARWRDMKQAAEESKGIDLTSGK